MKIKNQGQSLIEMLLAFFIMSLVVVAIVGLSTASVRNTSQARNNTLARRYAEEAMEWLRNQRDINWNTFQRKAKNSNANITYCFMELSESGIKQWTDNVNNHFCDTADPLESVNKSTIFYREVTLIRGEDLAATLEDESKNIILVTIRVFWSDPKGEHEVELSSELNNWNK